MSTDATSPSSPRTASLPLTGSATNGSLAPAPAAPATDRPAPNSLGAGLDRTPALSEFAHGAHTTWR
ncbi:hypothetical protein [Streptomyces sp. NPDC088360]|uniref:hypothetical protein n=1 Tax=Streptomyces sp. NPDC088360 TaxID=3154515 RepID=UPI00344D8221